jgi:tRNA A37 threonylcarbamoyltransferase TsaD
MILRPEQIHRLRAGCPVVPANMGGGGGSTSSSSDQATTTTNTDRRIANDSGVVATDGSNITVNAKTLDADVVNKALDFAGVVDATNGDSFSKLLDTVDKLTTKTQDASTTLASKFQDNVMQAWSQAKADATGSIDQRTIIVLGGLAAAALVLSKKR